MTSPEQPLAQPTPQPSRRDLRSRDDRSDQPLSRRELRAREQALRSGALLLDPSGKIQLNPEHQEETNRVPAELEDLHTGAVLPDGTVLTRRLLRELRQAAADGEPDAVSALSEMSALTAASAEELSAEEPSADEPSDEAAPTPPAARSRRSLRAAQHEASDHTGASFEYPMLEPPLQAQALRDVDQEGNLGPIQDLERVFPDQQQQPDSQPLPGYSDDFASSTMIPAITGQLSSYEQVPDTVSGAVPAQSEPEPSTPVRASVLGQKAHVDAASVPTPVRTPLETHVPEDSGKDIAKEVTEDVAGSASEPDEQHHAEPDSDDHAEHESEQDDDSLELDASFDAPVSWKPLAVKQAPAPARAEGEKRATRAQSVREVAPSKREKQSKIDTPSTPKLLKVLQWIVIFLAVAVLALLVYVLATQDDPLFGSAVAVGWDVELNFWQFVQGDV